jgi:hypothetical protein
MRKKDAEIAMLREQRNMAIEKTYEGVKFGSITALVDCEFLDDKILSAIAGIK